MDYRLLLAVLSLATVSSLAAPAWNDRTTYRDYDYPRGYDKRDDYAAPGPNDESRSHTYQSRVQCDELCLHICKANTVYLEGNEIPMYTCNQLKPPKQAAPFFQTLKGNSFYLSLFVVGVIVVGILVLITFCFCCSYCCRNPSSAESSRGSSKQALAHNEDGEFKEYLNGTGNGNGNGNGLSNGHHHHHDEIGAMKRERDFTRRPRPIPQIV